MKPHIKNLPCFNEVAAVIGKGNAQLELTRALSKNWFIRNQNSQVHVHKPVLVNSFLWGITPQGYNFWYLIREGKNPYEY